VRQIGTFHRFIVIDVMQTIHSFITRRFLADAVIFGYWYDNVVRPSVRLSVIHPTAKVSEQLNRNTILQLSAPYTDPIPQTAHPKMSKIDISGIAMLSMITCVIAGQYATSRCKPLLVRVSL